MVLVGLKVLFSDILYVLIILMVGMVVGLILVVIVYWKLKKYEMKEIVGLLFFFYMRKSIVIVLIFIGVLFVV